MSAQKPKKALTQREVTREIAHASGRTLKQVKQVAAALGGVMQRELSQRGPGVFRLLGFLELRVLRKAGAPERTAFHPFTGKPLRFPAKPARVVVKAKARKKLMDLVT